MASKDWEIAMPHVRGLFVENEEMIAFLRANKTKIRTVVSRHTGYAPELIAFIPDMVPRALALLDLADNMLPLEFVIDVGVRCAGRTKLINGRIKSQLLSGIEGVGRINFGIWLRTLTDNDFIEHKPA